MNVYNGSGNRKGLVHIILPDGTLPMAFYINGEFFQVAGRANVCDGMFSFLIPEGDYSIHGIFPGPWDPEASVSDYDWENTGDWTNTVEFCVSEKNRDIYLSVKRKLFGLVYALVPGRL